MLTVSFVIVPYGIVIKKCDITDCEVVVFAIEYVTLICEQGEKERLNEVALPFTNNVCVIDTISGASTNMYLPRSSEDVKFELLIL